ncbi:PREDICTED: UDP-glycosyltransferase 74F2-like [Ipomoea nil]|uniref:UDP-glycosyltransferase 74F2-like n=1 Tax=Ipomoea nil TaxID=35883 RepID=UPI000900D8D2|nr:PREDICTED: UDP-glycosyltransferase 74F2-like [Ipomoea nil]
MEREKRAHIVAIPYPSQGHINPMLQFCKRLVSKGLKTTLAITTFISNSMKPVSDAVGIDIISDGCDDAGFLQADSVPDYLNRFQVAGSKTLADLIERYKNSDSPVDCVIYDSFMPWALDVAKSHGLFAGCFFTQACAVNYVYYCAHHGILQLPVTSPPVRIPGLPALELRDMPSFIYVHGSYPAYFELVLHQFLNVEKADCVFVNSFYKLEAQVVDTMSKMSPVIPIGPTVPSLYLDNRVKNDSEYGINLYHMDPTKSIDWLNTKPEGSVIYVAFGSMASVDQKQMEELAWGFKNTNTYFLWVVRDSELPKLPENFLGDDDKALIVNWSPQLKVLASKAVGCFFTHGGWNSTIEALSLGVPMVAMPQWTDQTMNAKLIVDVWKVGKRVRVGEDGVVSRGEIEGCVREVLEGKEMKENAMKWSHLAKEAVSEGGTSDKVIDEFVSTLTTSSLSHV